MHKKTMIFIYLIAIALVAAGPARALHEKSSEDRIEELSTRIQALEKTTRKAPFPEHWLDKISVSGLVEAEAGYEKFDPDAAEEESGESSDIALSTVELGVDVDFIDHVGGHVLFLWEEDDTEPVDLDEGYISLTGTDQTPVYLHAGKQYIPFGRYNTLFISDPLPLELGETRESAITFGYHKNNFDLYSGGFNGDVDEIGENDHINGFFAGAEISLPEDDSRKFNLSAGVSCITNLTDSDGLTAANDVDEDGDPDGIRETVGGISAYIYAEYDHCLFCSAECVCAADEFGAGELNFGSAGKKHQPGAWNFEMAYVSPSDVGVGIKYEGADDCGDFLPETRYGAIVFCSPFDNTFLGLEYLYQEFENDDKSEVVTAQLAIEF